MSKSYPPFVFPTDFVERVNNAPLRKTLSEDNGDSSHPLYLRMLALDGADLGHPDPEEWMTFLAIASFLERGKGLVVYFTEQQLQRRIQLHVQYNRLAVGLVPNWDELDVPDEEGGVN